MKRGGVRFGVSLLALLAGAGVAQAQTAGDSGAAQADATQLSEVVVTAQRREQSAQDVGIALTVLSGENLQRQGVETVTDLQRITPSLQITPQFGTGQPTFTLRGIGFRDYATNNTPTVGVYVDEVAYPFPVMTQGVLFDVDRLEVLRGPQGTLYGRNTTGGAINVISRRPTAEPSLGFDVSFDNFGLIQAEGFVSGPVATGLGMRLSAVTEQGGAWQENRETGEELGDLDRTAIRLVTDWDATDRLNVQLNLNAYRDQSDGLGLQLFRNSAFVGPAPAHTGRRSTSWGMSPDFAQVTGLGDPRRRPFKDNEGWGGSLRVSYDLGRAELVYVGAHNSLDRKEYADFDAVTAGGAGVYFTSDISVQSHELRLASDGEGPLQYVVGAYLSDEELDEVYNSDFATTFGPIFQPIFNPPPGTPFAVRTPYRQEADSQAVFGQLEYRVTPALNLIGGLRYESEARELSGLGTFITYAPTLNFATATGTGFGERTLDTDEVTGKLAAEYTVSPDALLYASFSKGIKSGGFTAYNTLNPRGIDPFQPETLYAYEVGFKADLLDRTLRLNGAAYFYDYRDQQIQSAIFDPVSSAVVGKIVNAPESRIIGAELELLWRPTEQLTISQALGYAQGEFEEFRDLNAAAPPATIDRSGQEIGFPELTYSGEFAYAFDVGPTYPVRAAVNYTSRDEETFPLLGADYAIDSYWLVNADLAVRPNDGPVEVSLFVRNLFDEQYSLTRNTFLVGFGNDISAPGKVRTFGLRLTYRR
jgi:outer membrane receptor protein involved in Fe transport